MNKDKEILQIMGNNIKCARMQNKYTQEKLAELVGISSKFISMLERGESGLSTIKVVKICEILNIEPNYLFNGIVSYNDDKDKYIINSLSTLTKEDKDFIISAIEYILKKSNK